MFDTLLWNLLLTAGLAIVLAALCRLPSMHRRPALRYWLWLLLVVKLVTPPLLAVPLLPVIVSNDGTVAIAATPDQPAMLPQQAFEYPVQTMPAVDVTATGFADNGSEGDTTVATSLESSSTPYLAGLLAVSLFGTCLLLIVNAVRAANLYRWLNRAGTHNSLLAAACADVASSLGIREVVRSCAVDTRTTPLLLAWGRPLVVVPRQLIEDLSPQQLRGTVAHELAHLLRRDHWANLFVFIVKSLLWWNPVVWWAERELRVAQELCCDAIAIDHSGTNRRGYATTLLKALDFVQDEPLVPHALASRMGSRRSLLRRFEMIAETQLSYQLSRWSLLLLLAFAIPLTCIPVRAEQEKPAVAAAEVAADAKSEKTTADTKNKKPGDVENAKPASDSGSKKAETAKVKQAKVAEKPKTQTIDPEIKKLGEATRKRITTYSDVETLTLKDGQTGRMKIKKNVTPVAEILITPHFVENGTKFDLQGVDATGKAIEGTKANPGTIHNAQSERMSLGKTFSANGEDIFCKIQLTPKRTDDNSVAVEVKVLFTRLPTPEEINALLMSGGKDGQLHLDIQKISLYVMQHEAAAGHYPKALSELKKSLPKDVYSPTGEDYHYEAQQSRFILSSCGKDGIYGNDDDEMLIIHSSGSRSGHRHELYPLEKKSKASKEDVKSQSETTHSKRPQGNCSISGKVISAETGKPIANAQMYMHYNVTHGSIFIRTADDGTFIFKDIPKGPFSLQLSHSPGYQNVAYNPEDKPGQFPPFSLTDGEQRSGIVLKAKRGHHISGKIRDENGEIPGNINTLSVLGWFEKGDGKGYKSKHARVNRTDGSYLLNGLSDKPVYVMAIDWRAARKGNARPPIYHPGTFSRSDAKPITFGEKISADNIDITLKKEGGLILEGTVLDDAGKPVPEAFVVIHRRDMLFDFVTAYTDKQGHFEIQGLGDGEFQIHVDAVHRGLVRTRTPVDLDGKTKKTKQDFSLTRGARISGKFVDEEGKDWQIGQSYGRAYVEAPDQSTQGLGSFSLTNFRNKFRPTDSSRGSGGSFSLGDGDYYNNDMIFPTTSTFLIESMKPGHATIGFLPKKEGQKVLKILHDGQDVLKSGIETKPGQEIKDVTIVIGK